MLNYIQKLGLGEKTSLGWKLSPEEMQQVRELVRLQQQLERMSLEQLAAMPEQMRQWVEENASGLAPPSICG